MDPGDVRPYAVLFALSALAALVVTTAVPWWGWALAAALYAGSTLLFRYAPQLSERRAKVAVALALVLVVAAPGVVVAAHIAGTVPVQGDVPLSSTDNTTVVLEGNTDALLDDFTILSGTVDLKTEAGNMTVFSSGDTEVHVEASNITGTFTNVTQIATAGTTIDLDPADKQEITVGKNIDHVAWRDGTKANDGVVDFTYGSDASGNSRVTLRNVSANTQLFAQDANTGVALDFATSNSNGVVTFDNLDNSDHAVTLTTNDGDPVLSNARPTGNVNDSTITFKVDVNDTDFSDGDEVTAELFVEQNSQGTDTLTANGTASVTTTVDLGKDINYSWVATDLFGGRDEINATITTPTNITFREEHNASDIITGVNATVTFYSVDATTIVERDDSDNDGNVSLEGLPDKEFVVVAETDDHYTRRVYIESIFTQQNIFLLNKTEVPGSEAVNTTFVFEDRTGEFPPESTTLEIQRALDINNDSTYEWLTVAGDFWGAASEFPFTGEENARYRLVVENEEGDRRVLGTHIPVADGVKTVINGNIIFEALDGTGRWFDAVLNQSSDTIGFKYVDPENKTQDIRIQVYELGNKSNEIFDSNFTNSPYGTLQGEVSLTNAQAETSWVVTYSSTHDDEGDVTGSVTVGGAPINLPVDPWILAAMGVLGITFVGTLYGPRTATMGAWLMVLAALGLTTFGWLQFPAYSLVAAVAIAAGGTAYGEGLP